MQTSSTQSVKARRSATSITITTLTPVIGAEIGGVDISRPMDKETRGAIYQALLDHVVIFFRDQMLTPDQHKAFARQFGDIHIHPAVKGNVEGHPEILEMKADENSTPGAVAEVWHTDSSCDARPPKASVLYMHEVPANGGGDTMFANMYAAYDALSDTMKRMLEGLTAAHDGMSMLYANPVAARIGQDRPPATEHPIVRTHPDTGRKLLFVNEVYCTRIPQLTKSESDAVLQMLYRHIENPMFQCRFKWRPKSVAFWDNRCGQHRAIWDFYPQRRRAQRVAIL